MKTSNFEAKFIEALKIHLQDLHVDLQMKEPSLSNNSFNYAPDVVVENSRTGRRLFLEVKGGTSSNSVPFASLSKLKHIRNLEPDNLVSVFLVSSAEVPEAMRSMLRHEHIGVASVATVEEAIDQIDAELKKLERPHGGAAALDQ